MSSSSIGSSSIARGSSLYRPYSRSSSTSSISSIENLPPRTLARVSKEVRDLMRSPPEGINLVVDNETGLPASLGEIVVSLLLDVFQILSSVKRGKTLEKRNGIEIISHIYFLSHNRCCFFPYQAEIEGPQGTPYEKRFFRLKLVLGAEFPTAPPRGFFLTKIYHPNVDMSTGAICVNTLKRDWSPETTFSYILSVIRCLLINPFPESSLNDEAGKLFMGSYDEYSKRASLMADVHGRPHSSNAMPEGDDESDGRTDSPTKRKSRMEPGMNPLASKNSNSISSSNGGGKLGSKQASGRRMSKKKSLKRL